jgi:hypothetical protein
MNTTTQAAKRLLIAVLIILASWSMAMLLAIFGSQAIYRITSPRDVPFGAAFVIGMAISWVVFAFLLSLAERLMPFLITFAIPLVYWLSGYEFTPPQMIAVLVAVILFALLMRLRHRTLTPLLAMGSVILAYGLYLFPLLRPVFTGQHTAILAWVITLLVCWTALSVPLNLGIKGVLLLTEPPKQAEPELPPPPKELTPEEKIQQQITERVQRIEQIKTANENLSKDGEAKQG